jgi:cystathionine beta-lyase/cystathionine gamma-synthase
MKELKPEIVYAETISNPLLIVSDIKSIIGIASKYGAKTIIDNTFSTPFLFRPLESGADLVVHSVTKYLAGHGNISAGVICGNDDTLLTAALEYRKFTGHMMSPDDAYRLSTQLRTFRLRFVQQCENAVMLTEIFKNSGFISSVLYPGLETHRTHPEAQKTLGGKYFGAMITVDFSGNSEHEKRRRRDAFIKRVSDIIKLIPTLGDPHTILLPIESVWGAKYKEPGMLRISAGIEETNTLRIQVKEALEGLD